MEYYTVNFSRKTKTLQFMKKNLLTLATLLSIMKISAGQIFVRYFPVTLSKYARDASGQIILQKKVTLHIQGKS